MIPYYRGFNINVLGNLDEIGVQYSPFIGLTRRNSKRYCRNNLPKVYIGAELFNRSAGVYFGVSYAQDLSSSIQIIIAVENALKYNWQEERDEYNLRFKVSQLNIYRTNRPFISLSYYVQYSNLYGWTPVNMGVNFLFTRRPICTSPVELWGMKK